MNKSELSENNYIHFLNHEIFEIIKNNIDDDEKVFVIGGFVRDKLLNSNIIKKDIDIVTENDGIELAKKIAAMLNIKKINIFKNYGVAMIKMNDGLELEFVGARKESYNRDSRNPKVTKGTLADDQKRRDFTINSLAICLNKNNYGELIDPFDGIVDLQQKLIITPLDSHKTFDDDPLRMMRAIRFATTLNFQIEKNTLESIKKNKERLKIISQERITDELNKIIMSKKPSVGFELLFNTGLLNIFFPEMVMLHGTESKEGISHKDNFYHTLKVLDNISEHTDNLWLRWSAILHDIAKPQTKKYISSIGWTFYGHEFLGAKMVKRIFQRLKLPLDHKMKYVSKLVELHLRPMALTSEETSDSAYRRLLIDAGDILEDLLILCKSDITSKNKEKVEKFKNNYTFVLNKIYEIQEKDELRNWQAPIDGIEIMKTFDLKPSKIIGELKNKIKNAIIDGEVKNDRIEALKYLYLIANKEYNLTKKIDI